MISGVEIWGARLKWRIVIELEEGKKRQIADGASWVRDTRTTPLDCRFAAVSRLYLARGVPPRCIPFCRLPRFHAASERENYQPRFLEESYHRHKS